MTRVELYDNCGIAMHIYRKPFWKKFLKAHKVTSYNIRTGTKELLETYGAVLVSEGCTLYLMFEDECEAIRFVLEWS